MSKHVETSHRNSSSLTEDARELLAATADVAGEKVDQARKRVGIALESAKEIAGNLRDKTVAGAKATDKAVHEHPYKALAVALGVGALLGYVMAARSSKNT